MSNSGSFLDKHWKIISTVSVVITIVCIIVLGVSIGSKKQEVTAPKLSSNPNETKNKSSNTSKLSRENIDLNEETEDDKKNLDVGTSLLQSADLNKVMSANTQDMIQTLENYDKE